jgi:hypothetical protein
MLIGPDSRIAGSPSNGARELRLSLLRDAAAVRT